MNDNVSPNTDALGARREYLETQAMRSDADTAENDGIHGWACRECGRTHCLNSRGCECHAPQCQGTVVTLSTARQELGGEQ